MAAKPKSKARTSLLFKQWVLHPVQIGVTWWNKQLQPLHPLCRRCLNVSLYFFTAVGTAYGLAYAIQNMDQDTWMMLLFL